MPVGFSHLNTVHIVSFKYTWLTHPLSFSPSFLFMAGALCRNLRAGRGSREQEVSGEFQEVAAGGDDPGDRGRGGLTHRPETPVKGEPRQHSQHSSPTCLLHSPLPTQ